MKGVNGKILRVNLTDRTIKVEEPEEKFYRKHLGGRGLISYYLLKELEPGIDPLSPENLLIFAVGPLTGGPFAGAGRSSVGAKSPLTGGYGDSEGGGFWPAEFASAGYDALLVEGAADEPVYIWIDDGEVEIRSAENIWGKKLGEAERLIKQELGEKNLRVSQIGPAGENQVRYACIINDLAHAHGRTGMGAVMGSKNLRAVAVKGGEGPEIADRDKVMEQARWMAQNGRDEAYGLYDTGTAGITLSLSESGGLPTRNFQQGQFENAEKISGQKLRDTILKDRETCHACPINCKRVVETDDIDPQYGGPEYETIGSLGSNCGIDDLEAISKGHELCNSYGLDTISTGMNISFAMECFENGVINEEDTGGLQLNFGNAEAMLTLIEQIAKGKGFGKKLVKGVRHAAEKFPCMSPD